MSKPTPGPWAITPCSHGGMILRRGAGLTDHEQAFLQIMPTADARLIAAAPEMLEALKEVLTAWERGNPTVFQITAVKSAIAKAEGTEK